MLRDINFEAVYCTEDCNIVEDFYIPALSNSVTYERAVGFFSASVLSYAAQGLSALISNGGKMKLIIGYEVDPEDEQAIIKGYDLRELSERIGVSMVRSFDEVSDTLFSRRLEALSWLVAAGKLEIKIALKPKGMYHDKVGIFTDENGDQVIFQGSSNETTYGLLPEFNFESINVFASWKEELKDHYQPHLSRFHRLWSDKAKNTRVIDFPDAVKNKLIRYAQKSPRAFTVEQELSFFKPETIDEGASPYTFIPKVPETYKGNKFKLHDHQRDALNAWKAAGCTGILELATGAGKTITSIYGATKFFEATQRLFLVIAVPYQNLADQWVEELRHFSIVPIRCYVSTARWQGELYDTISRFNSGAQNFCCAVVVNASLSSSEFQSCLSLVPGESLMWIGDECHHHGGLKLSAALPDSARIRLGLSATPSHYMNDVANQRLEQYYGSTVYSYSLRQALDDEVLTPYNYHVVPVMLTDEEVDEYIVLSKKIAQAMNSETEGENKNLNKLLRDRARILSSAENKLIALDNLISESAPTPLTLFYCGDGRVEDPCGGDEERQIEVVSQILHDRGWKSARFTSHEQRAVRERLLDHFRLQIIDGLVAIRCLDEGIDIPGCQRAYLLASSRNPRQQIQRRGRILRKAEGKELAEIYDFLVMLPPASLEAGKYERSLLIKELGRVAEFASLARNHAKVVKSLLPILKEYNLTHLLAPESYSSSDTDTAEATSLTNHNEPMHVAAEKALKEIGEATHIKALAEYMQQNGFYDFGAIIPVSALSSCLDRNSINVNISRHTGREIFIRVDKAMYSLVEWAGT